MISAFRDSIRVLFCIAFAAAAPCALAHPALLSSSPKSREALVSSPTEMRLEFNEAIEPAFTSIKLVAPSGKEIPAGEVRIDKSDASVVVVRLPALAAGAYKARWSAVGRDGHRVRGEFSFSVK